MLLTLLMTATASAGPWDYGQGSGYAKVGYTRFASDDGFLAGEAMGLDLRSHNLDTYVGYGLVDGLDVIASLPLVHAVNVGADDTRYAHTWTGDLTVGLEKNLLKSRPLSLGVDARVPTYREPDAYARVRGLDDIYLDAIVEQFPLLGDRNVDLTAKLQAGASSREGWIAVEAGPRWRIGDYASGWFGTLNAGLWVRPEQLGVSLYSSGNRSWAAQEAQDPSRQLLQVRGTLMVAVPERSGMMIEAWGGGVVLADNASTGFDVGIGVSQRFSRER